VRSSHLPWNPAPWCPLCGWARTSRDRPTARLLAAELGVTPDPQTEALLAVSPIKELAPRTRYTERSGLHLAYQVIGEGPLDIVLVPGFVSHVERVWEEPRARAALMGLAQLGRLILFDRRGVGLSDRKRCSQATARTGILAASAHGISSSILLMGQPLTRRVRMSASQAWVSTAFNLQVSMSEAMMPQ
jgi:hypothetical protein